MERKTGHCWQRMGVSASKGRGGEEDSRMIKTRDVMNKRERMGHAGEGGRKRTDRVAGVEKRREGGALSPKSFMRVQGKQNQKQKEGLCQSKMNGYFRQQRRVLFE